MRFSLLGDHREGLDFARVMALSGRHELVSYTGPSAGLEELRRGGLSPRSIRDLEEVLADPLIEAVIVASRSEDRVAHLRRALQSERHVLCVHPLDGTPDPSYEAAMIQQDVGCVLLPLLPHALHPAVFELRSQLAQAESPIGRLQLLDFEINSTESVLLATGSVRRPFAVPGWDVLRTIGGEIAELTSFAEQDYLESDSIVLITGRFEKGGLFRLSLVPHQPDALWKLRLLGVPGEIALHFPHGWPGPAELMGPCQHAAWDACNPWVPVLEQFERQVAEIPQRPRAGTRPGFEPLGNAVLSWQSEVRALELDDAARRSLERRRASTLEYPEASEEVGFKGTMTLLGCGMLWALLFLVIMAAWIPWVLWLVLPLLGVFLVLQLLRWLARKEPQ